jgi:hypothetical protein
MAKETKRREWTKDEVRELKSLARQKTPVAKIAITETNTWSDAAEGLFTRRIVRHAWLGQTYSMGAPS